METISKLLELLRSQELELLALGVSGLRSRIEALLHPEFGEVGRSGQWFNRDTCVQFLVANASALNIECDGFDLKILEPNVAYLTYRSHERAPDGSRFNHALRFSLWQSTLAGWQLRYHQATPPHQPW